MFFATTSNFIGRGSDLAIFTVGTRWWQIPGETRLNLLQLDVNAWDFFILKMLLFPRLESEAG